MFAKVATRRVDSGGFFCPDCKSEQPYEKRETYRYSSLFGLRIGPRELLDTYIECLTCGQTYNIEVLDYRPPAPDDLVVLRAQEDLKSGTPLSTVTEKIRRLGYTSEAAEEIAKRALGDNYRWCESCEQAYHAQVEECLYCGEKPPFVNVVGP